MDGFCLSVDMRLRAFEQRPAGTEFCRLEDCTIRSKDARAQNAAMVAAVWAITTTPRSRGVRAMLRPFVFRRYIVSASSVTTYYGDDRPRVRRAV